MKTAEEWVQWFGSRHGCNAAEIKELIANIKQIQTDALMEAYRIVETRRNNYDDDGFSLDDIQKLMQSVNK